MNENKKTTKEIYNVKGMAESARRTEYRNIESAISEIVDNSLEAHADEIYIIILSKDNWDNGRKEISEIAILDNGDGMEPDILHGALSFGEGTRKERKGMGRFGVGLAQASLFSAPRVEVFSWKDNQTPRYSYLDVEEMKAGKQRNLSYPIEKNIPSYYSPLVSRNLYKSGTLVIWKNVDKSPVKRATTLMTRLDKELGRVYRYFIQNQGRKIYLIDNENKANKTLVKPRDPLFLMENDFFLADRKNLGKRSYNGEPVFEPFIPKGQSTNSVIVPIQCQNSYGTELEGEVTINFSIVKEKFYTKINGDPGNTEIGAHVRNYVGISIVRANREVEMGQFGFFSSINKPTQRWWGIEIKFDSLLDEVFKISNNKQHIELKKPSKQELADSLADDEKLVWTSLNEVIGSTLKEIEKTNKERRKGTRSNNTQKEPIIEKNHDENTDNSRRDSKNQSKEDEIHKKVNDILNFNSNASQSDSNIFCIDDEKLMEGRSLRIVPKKDKQLFFYLNINNKLIFPKDSNLNHEVFNSTILKAFSDVYYSKGNYLDTTDFLNKFTNSFNKIVSEGIK
jgi:hypothetical protein